MLSDFAYLIIDILITLPILFTVSYSKSAKGLTRKTPLGSLISFPVISSLLMHVVVTFLYQLMSVVVLEHFCDDFVPLDMENEDYDVHIQSYEQTTIFLASLCSYIVAGFVIHLHDKHLEVWYKNIAYDIGLVFTIVIAILLIAQNITGLNDFLMTRPTRSPSFFIFLVVSIVVMTLLLLGLEYFVCQYNLPKKIMEYFHPQRRMEPKIKKMKQYYIEEQIDEEPLRDENNNNNKDSFIDDESDDEDEILSVQQRIEKAKLEKKKIMSKLNKNKGKKQVVEWKEIVFKKPFYALLHEMKQFGEEYSSV
ncbi:MAG: hypothetical protein EZS28_012564 [Streblomastix strix]|uniref:Uncharacterized protein n=1 Tax=Streblomastix strix TaxID=222440 RepID=A0A5J4WC11_9EUKA|nr:MAG: hypothetical protein EZS28_012564 [Streblomastix strix]